MKDPYEKENLKIEDFEKNVLPYLFNKEPIQHLVTGSSSYGGDNYSFDVKKLIGYNEAFKPKSNSFVHFTSLKALHSILNTLTLRMYNLGSVNDPEEVKYFTDNFKIDSESTDRVKNSTFLLSACPSNVFNEKEILIMWDKYGDDGNGCAIEFEIKNPKYIEVVSGLGYANIIYPEKPLNFDIFNKALLEFNSKWNSKLNIDSVVKLTAILHKRMFWSYEQEVRLFFQHQDRISATQPFNEDFPVRFDFSSTGDITSYFELKLYDKILLEIEVKRIQIGYQHDENKLKKIRNHIKDIFFAKRKKTPIIELSPLREFLIRK